MELAALLTVLEFRDNVYFKKIIQQYHFARSYLSKEFKSHTSYEFLS